MRARHREAGSVTILALAMMVVGALCCLALARLGGGAVVRARADTAADAAALAAADALARGGPPSAAVSAARAVAAANGARLMKCTCAGSAAEVVVEVPGSAALGLAHPATGRARAEVDLSLHWSTPGSASTT